MSDQEDREFYVPPPSTTPNPYTAHMNGQFHGQPDLGYPTYGYVEDNQRLNGGATTRSTTPGPDAMFHQVSIERLPSKINERHVNMIAFSGTIGSGLFINTGELIATAGPGGALLAYVLVGAVYWAIIACLGEMVSFMPVKGPITEYPSRFLDRSVGFATGWMYWCVYIMGLPAQITVATSLMKFNFDDQYVWAFGLRTNSALWIFIFLVVTLALNMLPVQWFGEVEWILGSLKLLVIVILILLMFIIADGKATPHVPRPGFSKNWEHFFSNQSKIGDNVYTGPVGRLFAMWSSMTLVIFAYIGMEIFAVAAADTDLRSRTQGTYTPEIFKMAARKICIRIILLYCFAALSVSFVVNYKNDKLRQLEGTKSSKTFSPFIIAVATAQIHVLPHILTAFFITSALSAGFTALYVSSRTLHALAVQDMVPYKPLRESLKHARAGGTPWEAVGISWLFGLLAFLSTGTTPAKVFKVLSQISTIAALIVNMMICLTYIFFIKDLKKHKETMGEESWQYDRKDGNGRYPFASHFQPAKAYFGLISCTLFVIFNGYRACMMNPVDWRTVIASYICPFIFIGLVLIHKTIHRELKRWFRPDSDLRDVQFVRIGQLRRGRLNVKDGYGISLSNAKEFGRWILVWLK